MRRRHLSARLSPPDRARVGSSSISAGATLFGGDRLLTDDTGSVQLRTGAARVLLAGGSTIVLARDALLPEASLTRGTAVLAAANSAFALRVGEMVIRPAADKPTVAQVTVVGARRLLVTSRRGSLTVSVDDDVRLIPEGMSYRIVLRPSDAEPAATTASSQDSPSPGNTSEGGHPRGRTRKSGRNLFLWRLIPLPPFIAIIALWEALESPDRPNH